MEGQNPLTPDKRQGYAQSRTKDLALISTTATKIQNQLKQIGKSQKLIFKNQRLKEKIQGNISKSDQEKLGQKEDIDLSSKKIQFPLGSWNFEAANELAKKTQKPIQNYLLFEKRQVRILRLDQEKFEQKGERGPRNQHKRQQLYSQGQQYSLAQKPQVQPFEQHQIQGLKQKSFQRFDDDEIDIYQEKQLTWRTIYQMQLEKHKQTIIKLINNPFFGSQTSQIAAEKHRSFANILQSYLLNGLKVRAKMVSITAKLGQALDYLCSQYRNSMTQLQLKEYEKVLNQYYRQYYQTKVNFQRVSEASTYKSYFDNQPFCIEKALKLDILSYYLQSNQEYKQYYGASIPISTASGHFVSQIFKINVAVIDKLTDYYRSKYNFVSREHREFFQDFITATFLIQIKHKSEIAAENKEPEQQPSKLKLFEAAKREQLKQQKRDQSFEYTYNFSEIVFVPQGTGIKPINTAGRIEICQSLQKLLKEPYFEQKRQFLKIKRKFKVIFLALYNFLQDLKTNNQQSLKEFKHELNFKQNIKKCQWYFYKDSSSLQVLLTKLTKCQIDQHHIQEKDNIIQRQLYVLFIQRMKLLSEVLSAQLKVQKALTNCDFVYIHRFSYTFNQLKRPTLNHQCKNDKSLSCTVIIAVFLNKILFTCFIKDSIEMLKYSNILKDIFVDRISGLKQFSVVLYEFSLLKKFLEWLAFKRLMSFFFKKYKALTYISNTPEHFQIHFAIDLHIRKWFWKNSSKIDESNFYALLEQKLVKTSEIINDNTLNFQDQVFEAK